MAYHFLHDSIRFNITLRLTCLSPVLKLRAQKVKLAMLGLSQLSEEEGVLFPQNETLFDSDFINLSLRCPGKVHT